MEVEVGQKLFAVFRGYGYRSEPRCEEVTIEKVGTKYAYFGRERRFSLSNGEIDGYSGGRVYVSRTQYDQEREMEKSWDAVRSAVERTWRAPAHLTVADLTELKRILRVG
jgi:hypothetical protein